MLKRSIAVSLVVCLLLSFSVQASAASTLSDKLYTVATDIFAWLDSALFNGSSVHGGGRGSSPFGGGSRYTDYVNGIQSGIGTVQITSNGLCAFYKPIINYDYVSGFTYTYGNTCEASGKISSSGSISFNYGQSISIPFAAKIIPHLNYETDNATFGSGPLVINGVGYSLGQEINVSAGSVQLQYYTYYNSINSSNISSIRAKFWFDIIPYTGVLQNYYTAVDLTPNNRMTSVIPYVQTWNTTNQINNYYYGTVSDGQVTNIYETNIFNETTNVFTVPSSGTPVTISNWTYDYSTRTYVCIDSNSNTYIVQYGNDAVYVTVPDGNGGSVTTTYKYIIEEPKPDPGSTNDTTMFPNPSTDNYTDDPNTTGGFFSTIWKALKTGLASLLAGLIATLFAGITALIQGINSLFAGVFGLIGSFFNSFSTTGVFQFFQSNDLSGFTEFVQSCWSLMPNPIQSVFFLGISIAVLFGLVKKI